jgi:hypothetical protein
MRRVRSNKDANLLLIRGTDHTRSFQGCHSPCAAHSISWTTRAWRAPPPSSFPLSPRSEMSLLELEIKPTLRLTRRICLAAGTERMSHNPIVSWRGGNAQQPFLDIHALFSPPLPPNDEPRDAHVRRFTVDRRRAGMAHKPHLTSPHLTSYHRNFN